MTAFNAMQMAVDIVNSSEHDHNKIASCLFTDTDYNAQTNHRPAAFAVHFTPNMRVGGSSQYIHSEIACIFDADFPVEGASIAITDPPCPNCAKAICEVGINHVYIDHKGLDKDFAARRGDDFQSLSLLMFEKAGVAVSILYRKDKRLEPLITQPVLTRRGAARGIEFFDWDNAYTFKHYLALFRERQAHTAWAVGQVMENDQRLGVIVFEELTNGLTPQDYALHRRMSQKYRLPVDPLNRLLFFARQKGYDLVDNRVAVNLAPSSRAIVNAVGYGIRHIDVGEQKPDHDDLSHIAAELVKHHDILKIEYL